MLKLPNGYNYFAKTTNAQSLARYLSNRTFYTPTGHSKYPDNYYIRDFAIQNTGTSIAFSIETDCIVSQKLPAKGFLHRTNPLADGSITLFEKNVLQNMSTPIEIKVPASLILTKNSLATQEHWLDQRGSFSCIGSNSRKFIEQAGSRIALVPKDFRAETWQLKYRLKYVSGKEAAQPGNWFLYQQKLDIWNPYLNKSEVVNWIGLASCISLNYLSRIHCFHQELIERILDGVNSTQNKNPFQLFNKNAPSNFEWTQETWDKISNQDLTQYVKPPNPQFFNSVDALANLNTSPQGMQLARIEKVKAEKQQELLDVAKEHRDCRKAMSVAKANLAKAQEEMIQIALEIKKEEACIAAEETEAARLEIQQKALENLISKIDIGLNKKKEQISKQLALENTRLDAEQSTSFMSGLAKSGLVVDDITYLDKNGYTVSLNDYPEIAFTQNNRMNSMTLHTTKPIPIHFGIKHPKIAGPYKLVCTRDPVMLTVQSLTPWAAGRWDRKYFKVLPHSEGVYIDTTDPLEAARIITSNSTNVCMGELAASAEAAFHQQSPQYLAMAIFAFLQSVNPRDAWGKGYKDFPPLSALDKIPKIKFQKPRMRKPIPAYKNLYFVNESHSKFVHITPHGGTNGTTIRHGSLSWVDNVLKEFECKTTTTDSTLARSEIIQRELLFSTGETWQQDLITNVVPAPREAPKPSWLLDYAQLR
jgi:hypothetical protein